MSATASLDGPHPSDSASSELSGWAWGALWLVTVILYAQTLGFDFVGYDDPQYVVSNRTVRSGLTWSGMRWAWTTFDASNWHPLTWLSLMLDAQIFGIRAWGFHLTNLCLHLLNAIFLSAWLKQLGVDSRVNWWLTAVFAWHPVHVESVAWITERKDVLSGLFWMLTGLWYTLWLRTGKWGWYLASVIAFGLGLCSKPVLVTLPCALLLLDILWWRRLAGQDAVRNRPPPSAGSAADLALPGNRYVPWWQLLLEKLPFWLLCLLGCWLTYQAQHTGGAVSNLEKIPLYDRFNNIVVAYLKYLAMSYWPQNLGVFYPQRMNDWSVSGLTWGCVGLAALTVCFWSLRKRIPELLLGWLWYLGTLVPMIGLIQVGGQSMADRYLYLPQLGLAWGTAACLLALARRLACPPRLITTLALLSAAALIPPAWLQIRTWRDTEQLARQALRAAPHNYIAHHLLGLAYEEAGNWDAARQEYEAALKIAPAYRALRTNLGKMLATLGRLEEAVAQYRIGLKAEPNHFNLRMNLANALARMKRYPEALAEYRKAEKLNPGSAALYRNLAEACRQAGRWTEARRAFEQALRLESRDTQTQLRYAVLLATQPGRSPADRKRALEIASTHSQTRDLNALQSVLEIYAACEDWASVEVQATRMLSLAHSSRAEEWVQTADRWLQLSRDSLRPIAAPQQ